MGRSAALAPNHSSCRLAQSEKPQDKENDDDQADDVDDAVHEITFRVG
jgi:hypothetical protein